MGKNARGVFETALSSLFLTTAFWADNGKAPLWQGKAFILRKVSLLKPPFVVMPMMLYNALKCS